MAATCIMKQVEERHVATEIIKCVWSPKMDLVAIANSQAQVSMHRLYWQRVWIINSPGENVKVKGLAWRPDSKVLAIGYSSGKSNFASLFSVCIVYPRVIPTFFFYVCYIQTLLFLKIVVFTLVFSVWIYIIY
ncbi:anaphase-promoting complex subunit 4-like, partial [Penaeus indicus]|uniref:anaphase-promoting complex subunit 4-like n=1 Tax=Penaeus indicus TaxID=29960 RepID=UPI00300C7D12